MKISFTLYFCFLAFISINTIAQKAKKESGSDSSYWQTGLKYQNDNVYLGRKDSTRLPYIIPTIGYYDKSGISIDASLSYLNASGISRIDLVTIEAGYDYAKNNFEAQIEGSKFFYNSNSISVKSEVNSSIDAYTAYDFGFLRPSFEITGNFGNKSDIDLTLGLEHAFYALDSKLDITPSFFLNAATRNYYASYSNKKSLAALRKKKNATGMNVYNITAQAMDASRLKLLDYEITLPINYTCHRFTFNLTPYYAIPLNPATLLVTVKNATNTTTISSTSTVEKLSNIFYYAFGVTYNF